MAVCKNCGSSYNEEDVRNDMYIVAGMYIPRLMDGLCYSCAVEAYDEENGTDIEEEFEDLDDEEVEERGKEAFLTRFNLDKVFRSKFK